MTTSATSIGAAAVTRHADALAHLELLVTRKLDGLVSGDHEGLQRGAGSEPADARVYEPGDDARRIDWNLTARTNSTYVRDTIADRELETWLVIDSTASLDFGTAVTEKRDLALAAAGAYGLLTARAGNRVGAVLFDGSETQILPPRAGRDAMMAILKRLERRPRAGEHPGSLADAIRRFRLVARRRGALVVISDLMDNSDWDREVRAATRRYDVSIVEIRDPREDELPPVGLITLVDPETGTRLEVQSDSSRLRARFAEAAAQRRAETRMRVKRTGAAHLTLSTDRDWLRDIVRHTASQRRLR